MIEGEIIASSWDKKKIAIATGIVLFLGIVGIGVKSYLFPDSSKPNYKSVQGVNAQKASSDQNSDSAQKTQPFSVSQVRGNLQGKIDEIKKEVNTINVANVATSAPQIQKIMDDFKSLQALPGNQAKD